jgi:hypothetical protein
MLKMLTRSAPDYIQAIRMMDKAHGAGHPSTPSCLRAEPHLAFGPCDTPCKTWRHSLENGPCRDASLRVWCSWSNSDLSSQIRYCGFVNHATAYQPSAASALRWLHMQNIRLGFALLDDGAFCHTPLALQQRGSQLSTSQSSTLDTRMLIIPIVRENFLQRATGDLLHPNCVWLSREITVGEHLKLDPLQ